MPRSAAISAFPWGELQRVPRAAARNWGKVHRSLASAATSAAVPIAQALERWLDLPVSFEWRGLRPLQGEPSSPAGRLRLRLARGRGELIVCLDARLVTRLVTFAFKRDITFCDPLQIPDEEMLGAVAAIAAKLIDDGSPHLEVEFSAEPMTLPDAVRMQLDAVIRIDTAVYPVAIGIALHPWQLSLEPSRFSLPNLGSLPLGLPLVVGASLVTRDVLAELATGKAFLTGSGLWVDADRVGRGILIAPLSERGVAAQITLGGKIVLGDAGAPLNHDYSAHPEAISADISSIADAVSEAPVVVRVELGAVTLAAKQWGELRAGDIVETGQPVGTEVTLRVAGQALARGELLNIEGELGVRITQLLVGKP